MIMCILLCVYTYVMYVYIDACCLCTRNVGEKSDGNSRGFWFQEQPESLKPCFWWPESLLLAVDSLPYENLAHRPGEPENTKPPKGASQHSCALVL